MTARALVIGCLCLLMGCMRVEPVPELVELQDELVANKPSVWTFFNIESCSDRCNDSVCGCVTTPLCPASPAGQSCTTLGAHCVLRGTPPQHMTEYSCEQPPQYYRIANAKSGLCLNAASSANGAAVVQSTCTGTTAQDWQVETPASAISRILHRSSGKCLDIAANLAVLNPCDARASELFQPESSTRNVMLVRSNASSLANCLDVPSGSMAPGVQVQHFGCKNPSSAPNWFTGLQDASNQLWVFLPDP